MDVEKFSREVIDTYQDKARYMNRESARVGTMAQHATAAGDSGQMNSGNAARIARISIETFREKLADGMDRSEAAKATAREMSERFDSRGRDTQQRERQREGISL